MNFISLNHLTSPEVECGFVSSLKRQAWFFQLKVLKSKKIATVVSALKNRANLKQDFKLGKIFSWWFGLPSVPTHVLYWLSRNPRPWHSFHKQKVKFLFLVMCLRKVKGQLDEWTIQIDQKKEAYCLRQSSILHMWNTWYLY